MRNTIRSLHLLAIMVVLAITLQAARAQQAAPAKMGSKSLPVKAVANRSTNSSTASGLDQGCPLLASPRITAEVNERVLTTLAGNVHPLARPEYDRGRVADSLPMEHMVLLLQRSPEQEQALAERIEQMHTPRSSYFHQWLTAEDVGQCYGVADSDIGTVTSWLQSHGFQIDTVPAGKMMIVFSGTAGQVRTTFRTEIHNLNVRGEQHIANMSEPQVPAALAPVIAAFRSLNNFFPKPLVHFVGPIQRDSATGKWRLTNPNAAQGESGPKGGGPSPLITFNNGEYTFYAVGPQDFYTIYDETPLLTDPGPINGVGQTLAVVENSDVNPADVTSFRLQFGLPAYPSTPNPIQGGVNFTTGVSGFCADPGIVSGSETEADLDVQWIGTTAPAAIINFVSCADTATSFGGDLSAIWVVNAFGSTVSAFSYSFGECESQLGSGAGFYNSLWQQAVAEGQTPVISVGDSGDDVCDQGNGRGPHGQDIGETGLSVNGLASTPYNVAAGGTDFSDYYSNDIADYWNSNETSPYGSALSYIPEIAWNDSCGSTILYDYIGINYSNGAEGLCNDTGHQIEEEYTTLNGGSGGISNLYTIPSWQNVYGVGLSGNFTSTSNRNLPDVSLFAAEGLWDHLLMFCRSDLAPCDYWNGADSYALAAGGTSFVAPQLAGIVGLINQATLSRQGQANYALYALAAQEYGTPSDPNISTTAPSLYTCEGSNANVMPRFGGNGAIFSACMFYNINRTANNANCLNGDNSGCVVNNNDQPCVTGTPNCYTNTQGDRYGLLSYSTSTFETAFPSSFGYSAATGLGSINIANLVLNWDTPSGGYLLTVSFEEYPGTVISSDGYINCPGVCSHSYPPNSIVTLIGIPASGYALSAWLGACSGAGFCDVTMNANQAVTAWFWPNEGGVESLSVTVTGNGIVTSNPGPINCPGICSGGFYQNTQVTLTASPSAGSTFGGWIGACTGTSACNVTMNQSYSVTGEFTAPVQFVPVPPCRLVDTRNSHTPIRGGTFQDFAVPQLGGCNIPDSATAYSLNATVVPYEALGYLTVWPTGEDEPNVSTMNSYDERAKANAVIVPAGYQGAVSVYASSTTDVVLDIDGYFAPANSQSLQFYPLPPCRVADTRNPNGPLGGPYLSGNMERDFPVLDSTCIPSGVDIQAYSMNFTVVPHVPGEPLGFLTVWPEGETWPGVSTLNNPTGTAVANAALVKAGTNGGIATFPSNDTDLIIDINGYFAAPGGGGYSFYPAAPCRVYDSRNNGGQPFSGERTVNVVGSRCGPPSDAQAYVFNTTVVPSGALGYLTLWPDSRGQPYVSTLNAWDGLVTSNMAIVPNTDGSIDAYAAGLMQLILDISGYFAP